MNFNKQNYNDYKIESLESYNVIISTANYVSSNGTFNSMNYAIDWDFLPDQPYNVHFSYLGGVNNLTATGNDIANLFINFGCPNKTFLAGNTVSAINSTFLGVIKPYVLGATSFLLAEDNTNPPIYISTRPSNNLFTVDIRDNLNALFFPTTGTLAPYKIVLKFIPVKNFLSN